MGCCGTKFSKRWIAFARTLVSFSGGKLSNSSMRCGVLRGEALRGAQFGTSALHLALLAASVGAGDEVITTSNTFIGQLRQSFIRAPLQFSSIHTQPPGHQGSSPFSHPLRICGLRRKQRSPASFHSATGFRPYRLFARDEARSARADLNWIHGVRSGKHGGTSGQIVR